MSPEGKIRGKFGLDFHPSIGDNRFFPPHTDRELVRVPIAS